MSKINTMMEIAGLKCTLNMPQQLQQKFDENRQEQACGLPPYAPRPAYKVDDYHCPENWMNGSAQASSYFVPIEAGRGMWLDFNDNGKHTHDVAILISIQGVNPLTGEKTGAMRLEQYREKCPKHDVAFEADLYCPKCNHKWAPQNYICTTGTPGRQLWLDGFMAADGVVRQYIFTEEESRGVAAQLIGKDRVYAIGIAFYLSKKKKPVQKESQHRSSTEELTCGSHNFALAASAEAESIYGWKSPKVDMMYHPKQHMMNSSLGAACNDSAGASVEEKTCGGIKTPEKEKLKAAVSNARRVRQKTIEIGAGARIEQQVYRDPQELSYWEDKVSGMLYVNYVDTETCQQIIAAGKKDRNKSGEGFLGGLTVGTENG